MRSQDKKCRAGTAREQDGLRPTCGNDKNRTLLHVGGGALIGGLGGGGLGTAAQGAAGAGLAAMMAGKLNQLADGVGDATGSMTMGNVVSNVIAGAGGFLVGGNVGAVTAANEDLYNRSFGNADGKGSTGGPFGMGKDNPLKVDLVSQYCATGTCTDAQIKQLVQTQNELQHAAGENAMVAVKVGGAATAVGAGAIVAPGVTTAFGLGTLYDYLGDSVSYAMGWSKDGPNLGKSTTVGAVAGVASPLFLPLETLGASTLGKTVVVGYNAMVGGTSSFAGTAITNSAGNADLAGALGTTGGITGSAMQYILPGRMGSFTNQFIQFSLGPVQSAIEASKNKSSGK
jgi:filamentous hemagglutinin